MQEVFVRLRRYAQEVARELGAPSFYVEYDSEVMESLLFMQHDPMLVGVQEYVARLAEDDFGHGQRHVMLVTRDTGALVRIAAKTIDLPGETLPLMLRCAQAAGLLHDMRRKESHHAVKSADVAREVLGQFEFSPIEIETIAQAIANHEAFTRPAPLPTEVGQLISDCLYDADKFRWGPDNFTDTVWEMASFYKVPLERFVEAYHHGVDAIQRIRGSFRTPTGKAYGPEMIEMGLEIGNKVIEFVRNEMGGL
jgi:hypothetical protein